MELKDLDVIKANAKLIGRAVQINEVEEFKGFGLCQHPYTNSTMVCIGGRGNKPEMMVLNTDKNKAKYLAWMEKMIDSSDSFYGVLMLINKPWRYYLLSMCSEDLSEKQFSEALGEIWTETESPNNDANISIRSSIAMFKQANKDYLMENGELKFYNEMPDVMQVYRGCGTQTNKQGISYTLDRDKAIWFMNRFDRGECLISGSIKKEDVLAYFSRRGESEVVINPRKLINKKVLLAIDVE